MVKHIWKVGQFSTKVVSNVMFNKRWALILKKQVNLTSQFIETIKNTPFWEPPNLTMVQELQVIWIEPVTRQQSILNVVHFSWYNSVFTATDMGGETILKVGGHKCTSKNYGKFLKF